MKILINNKAYTLLHVDKVDTCGSLGSCDEPWIKSPKIKILRGQTEQAELDALVHEMLHASAYEILDEEFVTRAATDIARTLWKLGWRKTT